MKLSDIPGRIVPRFFAFVFFFVIPHAGFSAETNRSSGFLKSLGGFLSREAAPQTNAVPSTNAASQYSALQSLEDTLLNSARERAGTNALSAAQRLGAFLSSTNSPSGPDNSAATNITQKLRDWLAASQTSGTNTATNTLTQRTWLALTNAIAGHSLTNAVASGNSSTPGSISGTNLVQRLKDWIASERSTSGVSTNAASSSLAALDGYLNALHASISTNQPSALATNLPAFGVNQFSDRISATNSERRRFRSRE